MYYSNGQLEPLFAMRFLLYSSRSFHDSSNKIIFILLNVGFSWQFGHSVSISERTAVHGFWWCSYELCQNWWWKV